MDLRLSAIRAVIGRGSWQRVVRDGNQAAEQQRAGRRSG
jgi:hypothetical protein